MKCSECIKHDVCPYYKDIFSGFRGLIPRVFGPISPKSTEIDEFIGKICERSKYDKA